MKIGFQLGQSAEQPGTRGAALWLIQAAQLLWKRAGVSRLRAAERQMEMVETLALGGRKQLLLVRCGGESFLVGTGADTVQTIVRVSRYAPPDPFEEVFPCS